MISVKKDYYLNMKSNVMFYYEILCFENKYVSYKMLNAKDVKCYYKRSLLLHFNDIKLYFL